MGKGFEFPKPLPWVRQCTEIVCFSIVAFKTLIFLKILYSSETLDVRWDRW